MATTVAEIREMLKHANADEFEALDRSLAADTRKGVRTALEAARRRIASEESERLRLMALREFDRSHVPDGSSGMVVGLDEVGRGAVAGPLAVGAVVLPSEYAIADLNDSKQLTAEQREAVAANVKQIALAWTVAYVEPADIDRDGMSLSLRKAFKKALGNIEAQGINPEVVLIDGNPLGIDPREVNVVKGDSKSASIAAASVVAKVERDKLMGELSSTFPQYGFSDNKGYASEQHRDVIREQGLTPIHRRSFCTSFLQESLF